MNVLNSKGSMPHIHHGRDLIDNGGIHGRNNNHSQLSHNMNSDYNTSRRIHLRQIQKKNNLNASAIKENRYQKAYGQHVLPELKNSGSQIMLKNDLRKNI